MLGLFPVTSEVGFDIFGPSDQAFASLNNVIGGQTFFASLNMSTGAASIINTIGDAGIITDITVVPTPGAATVFGLMGLAAFRRRR